MDGYNKTFCHVVVNESLDKKEKAEVGIKSGRRVWV
jgi:hypothetical protein